MTHVILLVTWFAVGQPPSSYQVQFETADACLQARDAIFAEAARLKAEAAQRDAAAVGVVLTPGLAPYATAICAPISN